MTRDYSAPLPIGDRLVVRLRQVSLMRAGGLRWVGYRLTHPNGRRSLAGSDFAMRESAETYAKDHGWTVLG